MHSLPTDDAAGPRRRRAFSLSRWFAITALVSIAGLSTGIGLLLNDFLAEHMVAQEAALTHEFVSSLLIVELPIVRYTADPDSRGDSAAEGAFEHLARIPDVLRANLYDRGQKLIWSSDAAMVGRTFDLNPELTRALAGEVVAERVDPKDEGGGKDEHQALPERDAMFVEIYVPVTDASTGHVVGAIEFYKRPRALAQALAQLRTYIALGAVAGSVVLFAALFGLVRRADLTMRAQQRQLVDQTTLAALGEMSGAVAHGIRNPLASIRSSAELMQDGPPQAVAGAAQDIIAESDRLESWVRELLAYTQPLDEPAVPLAIGPLVQRCLDDFAREFERRQITLHHELPNDLPAVRGDTMLMDQVLRTLIANATEALGTSGGRIEVVGRATGTRGRGNVLLAVHDSGPGLTPEQLARVGRPFYTSKARGLGVGLAMARRVVERAGGRLEIDSAPGRGTTVSLRLATARASQDRR